MTNATQNTLHSVVLKVLRPIAAIFLRSGLSYAEFSTLARRAFVDAGFQRVIDSGKRPTVSAVAALTGLSRKEVKRLNEGDASELIEAGERRGRAARVISGWCNDPDYLSERDEPASLPVEGVAKSFASLVRQYSGDMTPAAMLDLLERSGNVTRQEGLVTLVSKAYVPMDTPADRLDIFGTDVSELVATIGHNLDTPPDERYFQLKVSTNRLDAEALSDFKKFTDRGSMELLEEYDAWIAQHEVNSADDPSATYVAVGIYYFDEQLRKSEL